MDLLGTLLESGTNQRVVAPKDLFHDARKFGWRQHLQSIQMPAVLLTQLGELLFSFSLRHFASPRMSSPLTYCLPVLATIMAVRKHEMLSYTPITSFKKRHERRPL